MSTKPANVEIASYFHHPVGDRIYIGAGGRITEGLPGGQGLASNLIAPNGERYNFVADDSTPDGWYSAQNFGEYNPDISPGHVEYHTGEDWNSSTGSDAGLPVYAAAAGMVVRVGHDGVGIYGKAFGNYVVLKHWLPDGKVVYSLYAHLQSIDPAVDTATTGDFQGKPVAIDQQIGKIGHTGDAGGHDHLHFEMYSGELASTETFLDEHGYSDKARPSGWVDPTDFINSHATALVQTSVSNNSFLSTVDSTVKFLFSGIVHAVTGAINLFKSDGALVETMPILDTNHVQFVDKVVEVHPTVQLLPSTNYYLTVASGAIADSLGNSVAGITPSSPLNFSTAATANTSSIFLSISDNSVLEGSNGSKTLSFGVTLTGAGAGSQTVSVQYSTQDIAGASSPALAGQDYAVASGVLVIPAGQTSGTINVTVFGDTQLESDEVFRLLLSQPSSGVTLLNSSGQASSSIFATGFINNDDQAPNHSPKTVTDLTIASPGTTFLMDVLQNDSDPDNDALHISQLFDVSLGGTASLAGSGTVSLSGNQVSVSINAGVSGIYSFGYVADDGRGGAANGYASIIVGGDGTAGITNSGTSGPDRIVGSNGNDVLSGGSGDDVIAGGPGADRIDGGSGFDYLDLRSAAHRAFIQFRDPWTFDDGDGGHDILSNIEGVLGTPFDDVIDGNSGNIQRIWTGYRLYGYDGNDKLTSDAGDDVLDGGAGDDILIYGAGHDVVVGGPGNDQIYGQYNQSDALSDILHGGAGDDFIYATDGTSGDQVFGDEGNDYIQFGDGDVVSGGDGQDTFRLGGYNPSRALHATIVDLGAGEQIKWNFPTPLVVNNTAVYFVGPITAGNGTSTALDHVEYATSAGKTTLYFGYDSNPGADFVLDIVGTFAIDQFTVDSSDSNNLTIQLQKPANHVPAVAGSNVSVGHDAQPLVSTLFSVTDVDSDAIVQYRFWDDTADAASGHLVFDGAVQDALQNVDVTASQLPLTIFKPGAVSDSFWVQVYDGYSWSAWKNFTITPVANTPAVVSATNFTATHNQNIAASNLFSASDADGDTVTAYQFWDSTVESTSGHWIVGGVAQAPNATIDVTAAQLANTTFQSGSGSDDLWVRVFDGTVWGAWKEFHVNAPANHAPVAAASDQAVAKNASIAASSLFSATDADNDTIAAYRFWDSTADAVSGHFSIGGVAQGANQNINVSAAQLSSTTFQTGTVADDLWVQVFDGTEWSSWKEFHLNPPVNRAPVVAASDFTASHNQNIAASSLFSVTDADNDTITAYQFWDSTVDATSGHFVVGGVAKSASQAVDVSAAQLAGTTFQSSSGPDDLWVRVFDGTAWSAWKEFHVNAPLNRAPTVTASDFTATHNQNIAASSLFSVTDADGDAITTYRFWDSTADATSGHFVVGGVSKGANQNIDVSAGQLAGTTFQSESGSDDLWVQTFDGTVWSAWKEFHVNAPLNQAPIVTASDFTATHNQNIAASSLFSVTDADGDAMATYRFWDSTADATSGHFVVGGVAKGANQSIDVSAGQLASTTFQSGSGSDDLWVQTFDGTSWSSWKEFHVNAPVNRAPGVTAGDRTAAQNTSLAASSLFSVSDADNDVITAYNFWDSTADAASGRFSIGGVAQGSGQNINVSAAQLSSTTFQTGTVSDDLWVQAFDGTAWSAWKEFHIMV